MRVPVGAVKRLMAAACPTHATTIECDGGPPAVIAHFPCIDGHFDCKGSTVRLLSIAQERLVQSMRGRLGRAHEKNAQLTQALAVLRGGT